MPNPVNLTTNDTSPDVVGVLYSASGIQDLTGCVVSLRLKLPNGAVMTYTGHLSTDPTDGEVTVERGDLSGVASGLYNAEYRVTFPGGDVGTFPTPGILQFRFSDRRT